MFLPVCLSVCLFVVPLECQVTDEVMNEFTIYTNFCAVVLGRQSKDELVGGQNPMAIHRDPKNCAKLFLSQLRQMSINFDNFWHTDSTKDSFMWGVLIFHLT